MRVDYSMFEGFRVKGNARTVMSRGEVIVDHGKFFVKPRPQPVFEARGSGRGVGVGVA